MNHEKEVANQMNQGTLFGVERVGGVRRPAPSIESPRGRGG